MPHDKIRAAARKRMAETGESYAAARRAVVTEHSAAHGPIPSPGAGCALAMSDEIHEWLADLRRSDPAAAMVVGQALAALMNQGASLGEPLAVSTADSWPWALAEALDRSYQERLEQLSALRRGQADAANLVKDIQKQAAAHSSLLVHKTIATPGPAGDDGDRQQEGGGEAIRTADARLLRDVTAQMERELGQQALPPGLMDLRPAAPDGTGIRILFAVEPPGTALLIAVLDGTEAVQDQYLKAILLSADMLHRVRADQAPEAAAHRYNDTRSFLEEFYPGDVGAEPAEPRPR